MFISDNISILLCNVIWLRYTVLSLAKSAWTKEHAF